MKLFNFISKKETAPRTERQKTGDLGEAIALEYLEKEGFVLIEKNWRHAHSEIDLIMNDDGCIVFCEVRTQRWESTHYKTPSESISYEKRVSLSKGAAWYLETHGSKFTPPRSRFDIVEVFLEQGEVKEINHIKDAFYNTHPKKKGTRYKSCRQ